MTTRFRSTLIAAAAVVSLGACATTSTPTNDQTPTRSNRSIITGSGARATDNSITSSASTVSIAPAEMFAALTEAYGDLGIEVKLSNPQTGEVGNRNFQKMFRLGGLPMSDWVGCGVTTTGQAADNYRVTMSLVSRVTPSATGSSVKTELTAYAEDISSSKGTLSCATLGTLEARVQELALRHVRGS